MSLVSQIRPALVITLLLTLLLGVGYPLAVTGVARLAFPRQAEGSLVRDAKGQVIGSTLIAQAFARPEYLHPRPSAAGNDGYDASGSSGSNLGPLNPDLAKRIAKDADALRKDGATGPIPADALTTSGSGLDPAVSPANARTQAARIAAARGVSLGAVEKVIDDNTTAPALGVLGQPAVNVLQVNLALDAAMPKAHLPAS
jgi:K+-transporting ATPase ATPase C chain